MQIYSTPPAGSQEIAQLESSSAVGFGTQGQTDAAVARLKREAAALGANGVVLMGVGSSGSPVGMSVGAGTFGSHVGGGVGIGIPTTQKRAAGVAIWVPNPAPPARLPTQVITRSGDAAPQVVPAAGRQPQESFLRQGQCRPAAGTTR